MVYGFRMPQLACLILVLAVSVAWGAIPAIFPSLKDASIDDLKNGLNKGLFASVDLTKAYIARIHEVNEVVHAVTEINPDALDIAADLDKQRAQGIIQGPLHGIPILLKDNIATADQMNNTSGSLALLGAKVSRDSFTAHKLRSAGAIIIGKTTLSQWANMRSRTSSAGWSSYGGQCHAAYHPRQDPFGSSSGSAVAADLALAAVTIGTETDGSITIPAGRSGVAGIKPTVGLTSRHLVVPISERQDSVGPMARSVRDAAMVLQVMEGFDEHDNYTSAIPEGQRDYVKACDEGRLQGKRIGVPWNVVDLRLAQEPNLFPEVEELTKTLDKLRAAGVSVVDANFTAAAETLVDPGEDIVLNADFLVNLKAYLSQLTLNPNEIHSLADLRKFTHNNPLERHPHYDTSVWDEALDTQGWNNTSPFFWLQYQHNLHLTGGGGLIGAIDSYALDAVVLPTSMSKKWAAMNGAPIVSVPMGYYPATADVVCDERGEMVKTGPGVPFGLALLGKHWSEETLVGLACGIESVIGAREKGRHWVGPKSEIWDGKDMSKRSNEL